MRYLLPVALLLTACGGSRVGQDGKDAGAADAGVPDAGPHDWSGLWDFRGENDPVNVVPCDGGGSINVNPIGSSEESVRLYPADGGVHVYAQDGILWPISSDGTTHYGPWGRGSVLSPESTHTNLFATIDGQFKPAPDRFEGSVLWEAWDGQCTGSFSVTWTKLDGGQ